MMARDTKGSKQRPDTLMQDRTSPTRRSLLATHGRTIHLGQKQTSRPAWTLSALPPKADIERHGWHVRFVPKADSCTTAKASLDHLIGSSLQGKRNRQAERLGRLEIDDEFKS